MSLQPDGLSTVPLPDFNGAEQPADVDWRVIAENRDRELRAVGEARYKAERERDSLARRLNERYQQLGEARTALHRVTEEVAAVRAAALRDFAASMRALAEQAPEGEPASWPWSAYALAAVKAEEHAGKGFPSDDADQTPDVGTPDHPECVCDLIDVSAGPHDIAFVRGQSNGCRVHPDPRAVDIAEAKRRAREAP
jgi:hypothetical protein